MKTVRSDCLLDRHVRNHPFAQLANPSTFPFPFLLSTSWSSPQEETSLKIAQLNCRSFLPNVLLLHELMQSVWKVTSLASRRLG